MTTIDITQDEIEDIHMTTIDIYAAHNPQDKVSTEIDDKYITGDIIYLRRPVYDRIARRVRMIEGDRLIARIVGLNPDLDYARGIRSIICD